MVYLDRVQNIRKSKQTLVKKRKRGNKKVSGMICLINFTEMQHIFFHVRADNILEYAYELLFSGTGSCREIIIKETNRSLQDHVKGSYVFNSVL